MNQAGKISVKVHSASGFRATPATSDAGSAPRRQVYCVCEVPGYGRLCTDPRDAGSGPDEPTLWEQELTFEVGPSQEPKKLHAALYAVVDEEAQRGRRSEAEGEKGDGESDSDTDEFIGSGSMSLAHLEEVQQQHHVRIPIVSTAGAHLADLSVDLRFFHSRTPARQRDATGREFIDSHLAAVGPANAAKLLNERSPHSPTRAQRPGSPRIKPPPHDPPVREITTTVRTTLAGGEEDLAEQQEE